MSDYLLILPVSIPLHGTSCEYVFKSLHRAINSRELDHRFVVYILKYTMASMEGRHQCFPIDNISHDESIIRKFELEELERRYHDIP